MENEIIIPIEAIAEHIKKAAQETKEFSPPLAPWQTADSVADEINAAYGEEIAEYCRNPAAPCGKADSLKFLKRFARKSFHDFWVSPVSEYLPAVSEGTMKLCETVYPHSEAIRHAKDLIASLSPEELAKDFLYGVAHNAPEYRSALACYFYVKNLPEHEFEKKFIGSVPNKNGEWVDKYNDTTCEVCSYWHTVSSEPKMQFYHVNMSMWRFYSRAMIPFRFELNSAILFLEEYKRLPRPAHSSADYELFRNVLKVIENAPPNMTSSKLRRELKQSGLLTMTVDQIESFIDMLGYLNILHPDDSFGVTVKHIRERDMLPPLSGRGYAAYPVNRWTRKCGVDYGSVSMLFDGIYDENN